MAEKTRNVEKAYDKAASELFDNYSLLITKVIVKNEKTGKEEKKDITTQHFKDYLKAFKITNSDDFLVSLGNDVTRIETIPLLTLEKKDLDKMAEIQVKAPVQAQIEPVDTMQTIVPKRLEPAPSLKSPSRTTRRAEAPMPQVKIPEQEQKQISPVPETSKLKRKGEIQLPDSKDNAEKAQQANPQVSVKSLTITGGAGTYEDPYVVNAPRLAENGFGAQTVSTSKQSVLLLNGGRLCFKLNFQAAYLADSRIEQTKREFSDFVSLKVYSHVKSQRGISDDASGARGASVSLIKKMIADERLSLQRGDLNMLKYLKSN